MRFTKFQHTTFQKNQCSIFIVNIKKINNNSEKRGRAVSFQNYEKMFVLFQDELLLCLTGLVMGKVNGICTARQQRIRDTTSVKKVSVFLI